MIKKTAVLYTSFTCPNCFFAGIEFIFRPGYAFSVYKDDDGYYVKGNFIVGQLRIWKLHFGPDALGKLHERVGQIRCIKDIKYLAEDLSSDDVVIRNEAKRKFDELEGATK